MVGSKNYAPQEYDVVRDTISALESKVREIQGSYGYEGDRLCAEAMEMINYKERQII